MGSLQWQPLHRALVEQARSRDALELVVSPYVKVDALERLWAETEPDPGRFALVARWHPTDLLAGVSDIEVYEFLATRGAKLYVHPRLHMKLYSFSSQRALVTSGNLTLAGLGYAEESRWNIEAGSFVSMNLIDLSRLYVVLREARLVTHEVYERYRAYLALNKAALPLVEPPDMFGPVTLGVSLADLPATEDPHTLWEVYSDHAVRADISRDLLSQVAQDLSTFAVPMGLDEQLFFQHLRQRFTKSPFVVSFLARLRQDGWLRFGAVNAWIGEHCADTPLPCSWDVKPRTRAFYNWLELFVPEVSWDRPNHTQVIRWTPSGG